MERVIFILPESFLAELENCHDRTEHVHKMLSDNISFLTDLIAGYHFASRGKVYDAVIVDGSLSVTNDYRGNFRAKYKIMYTNGCQDLTYDDKDDKVIFFEINTNAKNITLTGEVVPERLPDEF